MSYRSRQIHRLLAFFTATLWTFQVASLSHAKRQAVFVGTYTVGTDSRGIYTLWFDDVTGTLEAGPVATGSANPSFLAIRKDGRTLFSSDEVDAIDGEKSGAVSAYAINRETGELSFVNRQLAGGTSPCHLCVDDDAKHVLVVGYGSGTVGVLPIDAEGKLQPLTTRIERTGRGVHPQRQTSPHPHEIVLAPDGRFAFVPDLGTDEIAQFRYDLASGKLEANDPPVARSAAGAGPRHLAFHPVRPWVYVVNELDLTVDQFDYDVSSGVLANPRTTPAIAENAERTNVTAAEIAVHPDGKRLYASLRGPDEIVVFRLDEGTGAPRVVGRTPTGGKTPRNFALDPSGTWLLAANQGSGSIVVFKIGADGTLSPTGARIDVPAPTCVAFLP